jgi:hypothetical protein
VKATIQSMWPRLRQRQYTPAMLRIGLGCALLSAVGLVELGTTSGADSSFVSGNAQAQAQAMSLAPTTGGLSYAITLATSISDYQDVEAQSLSQTLDLGTIGTALESDGCNNSPPTLPQSDVPPPEQAESTNGNQDLTDSITPQSTDTGLGVGNETAIATTQPSSDSTTTTATASVPGNVIDVGDMTTSAHASVDNGNTRTAWATADIGQLSLANGLVVLGGLHWDAEEQSGGATQTTGTFSIGSLTVAGVPVDLSAADVSPQSELDVINTALSPIGFNIVWPVQSTLPDGTVVISPLQVGIDDNALGQELIGANLGSVQAEREAVVNALLNADCNLATEVTVGDIGTGVAAGGGNMNILLGGATALTNDQAGSSPFGPAGAPSASVPSLGASGNSGSGVTAAGLTAGNSGAGFTPSDSSLSTSLPGGSTSSGSTPSSSTAPSAQALGPLHKTADCFSLGPSGGGCYTGNVAVPIGLGVIALLSGLFTWDYVRQRRRGPLHAVTEVTQ